MNGSKSSIIIVTPCCYLLAGLEALLSTFLLIQVAPTDSTHMMLEAPGADMLIVARESGAPADIARAQAVMWRLEYLMRRGMMRRIPCLLLAENMSIQVEVKTFWLERQYLAYELDLVLSNVTSNPELYQRPSVNWFPLSPRQRQILTALMSGREVKEIAEELHLQPRTVFACRDSLIKKLGLRNRIDLMCLGTPGFSIATEI
ncbi:DNA-binding transcriptional activator UhpA [Citrobacter freundii]|nr:DNA-binding transcriptional activator UhpA [Citrobacter freundii]